MTEIVSKISEVNVSGDSDPEFDRVRDVFIENFNSRGEIGAGLCVYKNGRQVVDLWGGYRDGARSKLWERDTIICMMSVGKSIAALGLHMLIDRGEIELDAPVADYWPAFAQAGKSTITVKQLLGGLAGLIYAEHAPAGALLDWGEMIAALEKQTPVWPPGSKGAYHSMTAGFLLGELVHKVDGRDIATFTREEISTPLQIDFMFGVSDADLARVAEIIPNPKSEFFKAFSDPNSMVGKAWRVAPKTEGFFPNSRDFLQSMLPTANGVGNARAVARIYTALVQGGEIDGVRLLSSAAIDRACELQWEGECGMSDLHLRYGLGFLLNNPPLLPMGPNLSSFGHPGAGGSIGFADPQAGLAFSYSPNFLCEGAGIGERCEALIESLY